MKRYIFSLVILVLLVFTAIPIYASSTSGAAYLGIVAVTDNGARQLVYHVTFLV